MIVLTTSIFVERRAEDLNWVIFILVGTMLVLSISRVLFSNNFLAIGNIERFLEVKDNQLIFSFINQFLFAILLGTICVPFLTNDYDYILYTPLLKAFVVAVVMVLFFWTKSLFSNLGAYAFRVGSNSMFNLRVSSYYRFYSVAVLWVSVLLFYFTALPKIPLLLGCVLILLILRTLQVVYRIKNQQEQFGKIWYYNILYLCALEILPLLVLYKFLTVW